MALSSEALFYVAEWIIQPNKRNVNRVHDLFLLNKRFDFAIIICFFFYKNGNKETSHMPITPQEFISKWKCETAREKQIYQEHFINIRQLVGLQPSERLRPNR
jgi:hypothetical protein